MPIKPNEKEEEYFTKLEFEKRKKIENERREKLKEEEKLKLKELHYMKCPKCGMELIEIDLKGIKIDKCSACNGLWFDAGEFEAISKMGKTPFEKLLSFFTDK